MSDGPTTVGSIVGKLRMDRAEWVAAVAATKAEIRDLEGSDPDIHIDTNAASVVSQLGAAAAATDALGVKTADLGRKTQSAADATIKANEANKTSVTRVGAIATAVALLVPLLAPVGAAAIGVGSAMLGMGAAGVLALVGINREMEQGTVVGRAFSDGIDSLKGSMNTLASTAAVNMLSSFQRVVAATRQAMPELNTQVGQFSGLLGRSGGNLFVGVINSLRVLNPLFLTAGVYLEQLTAGFQAWTQGSGIQDFGGYALATLPQVTELLGKLASAVMHILQALAPLGTIGMAVLVGVSDVISAIPVEVLSQLIVTLTWGAIAFKAWGFVAPMLATIASSMGAVGVATTIATGPIGWVVAGLAALAGIFAVVIANNTGATRAMQDYTAAVDADTGAIGENVRAKAAQKLLDEGAFEAAKKLGVSTQVVLDATLGNAAAQRALNEALEIGTNGSKKQKDQLDKTGLGLVDYGLAVRTVRDAVDSNSVAIEGELGRYKELEGVLGATASSTQTASDAYMDAAGAAAELSSQIQELVDQINAANGIGQDAVTANANYQEALKGVGDEVARQRDEYERLNGTLDGFTLSLDESTAAGSGHASMLAEVAGKAQDAAQKQFDLDLATMSSKDAADKYAGTLAAQRQAFIDSAIEAGFNADQVQALADKVFALPTEKEMRLLVEKSRAVADIEDVRARLNSLPDITRRINMVVNYPNGNPLSDQQLANQFGIGGGSMGGTFPGLAGGGSGGTITGPGNAGSDTAGIFRLANGEEVISNMFGQADRNRGLLKQINAGFTPSPSSAGSVATAPQSAATIGTPTVHVYIGDEEVTGRVRVVVQDEIGRKVRSARLGGGR